MNKQIVECVPNFSEGRDLTIIDQIAESIASVEGITILHRTSDADHNRSVITFAGTPDATLEAGFLAIQTASQLIDLTSHSGEHPRIGATDVFPFVPIKNITMQECIALAEQLAQRVATELKIPTYLYAEASRVPERRELSFLRRGGYEMLKQEIALEHRLPDFGDPTLGKAGATIIGARPVLIAYNIFLNTSDVKIAKRIARSIREANYGLPTVRALGLLVDNTAQVSMNILDYRKAPLYRVNEWVRREAERYGTTIQRTELIGLMPRDALIQSAIWYLQLNTDDEKRVLEQLIESANKDL